MPSVDEVREQIETKCINLAEIAAAGADFARLVTLLYLNQDLMATSLGNPTNSTLHHDDRLSS